MATKPATDKRLKTATIAKKLGTTKEKLLRMAGRMVGFPKIRQSDDTLPFWEVAELLYYDVSFDLPVEVQVWMEERITEAAEESGEPPLLEKDSVRMALEKEKLRKAKHDARLAELRADKAEGEVIAVDEVIEAVTPLIIAAMTELKSMGGRVAPLVAREDNVHRCQVIIDDALTVALDGLRQMDVSAIANRASQRTASQRSRDLDRRTKNR